MTKLVHGKLMRSCGAREESCPEDEFYFQWHITERCNLRCTHCYHDSYENSAELNLAQLLSTADKMVAAIEKWGKSGSFSLTGGEPLLRRGELFAIAKNLDSAPAAHYYDILTNGSLIDAPTIDELSGLEKLRRIQVSLEGASPHTNDIVRGAGSFRKTLDAIGLMKKAGLTVAVMTTLRRSNASEIETLIDMLEGEGVDTFAIERFIPEGQGAAISGEAMSSGEIHAAFERIHSVGVKARPMRVLMYRPLFCLIDPEDETVGAMCSVGTNALTVMQDGTIYPCRRLPISIGNILTDSLYKVWYDSPLLWEVRKPSNLKGKCGQCECLPICRGCRAAAFAHTGDYLDEDPQCWK